MRSLSILLCPLLVLTPALGQQAVPRFAPSFYVPYGVRDVPAAPLEEYSSSDAHPGQPYEIAFAAPSPQMHRQYPMRRRPFRPYHNSIGPGYAPFGEPQPSVAEVAIGLGFAAFLLTALALRGE